MWQRLLTVSWISMFPLSRNNRTLTFVWTHNQQSKRLIMQLKLKKMLYCKNFMWGFWSFLILNVASYSSSLLHFAFWSVGVIARASASILHHKFEDHTSGRQWSRDPEKSWVSTDHAKATRALNYLPLDFSFYTFVFQGFVIHRNLGSGFSY